VHGVLTRVRRLSRMRLLPSLASGLPVALLVAACGPPPGSPPRTGGAEPATSAPASSAAPTPAAAPAFAPASAVAPVDCAGTDPTSVDPESVEIIQPDRPVPDFHVATVGCTPLHAHELIGPKPLVILFYSSWCRVCEQKLPAVKRALDRIGNEATTFAVALDDDETWARAEPFLARYGIEVPLVRGDRFQRFSLGYNPFRSIPVVVVVGRDGLPIDLQLGASPFDENRLLGAVAVGKSRPPLARDGTAADGSAEPVTP
jgi:hypothetical protein